MSHIDPKKKAAYNRKWRRENPEQNSIQRKKPSIRFSAGKSVAKSHGHVWAISKRRYIKLVTKPCYYCGRSLADEIGVGLDRINNNRGYYPNNVLPCCGICNKVRNNVFTVEEMLLLGKVIAEIYNKRPTLDLKKKERKYLEKIKKRKLERQQKVLNHMNEILEFCYTNGIRPGDNGDSKQRESQLAALLYSYLNRKSWYRTLNPKFYTEIKRFKSKSPHPKRKNNV